MVKAVVTHRGKLGKGQRQKRCQSCLFCYHFFTDDPCEPFAGAERVLQHLHEAGYLLAVATGKGRRGLDRAARGGLPGRVRCRPEFSSSI